MIFNRRFGILLIANCINILAQWSVLSLLTKFHNYAELGKFSLALAFIAPILTISSAQIKTLVASDIKNIHTISAYFSTRILLWLISLFFVIILSIWSYDQYMNTFILYLSVKSIESLSDICYGFNLRNEQEKKIAFSILLRGILGWMGMSIITIYFGSIESGLVYLLIINLIILISFDLSNFKLSRQIIFKFLSLENRKILFLLIPFGFIAALSSLSSSIPRLFIESMLNLKLLAIYTNLCYVWIAGSYIAYTLGDSMITKLATYIGEKDWQSLYQMIKYLLKLSLFIAILSISLSFLFGKEFLEIIYSKDIQNYNNTFIVIMSIMPLSFIYPFISNYFIITNKSFFQLFIHLLSFLAISLLCYFLIPKINILGAAIAQLTGYAILVLIAIIQILKEQKKTKQIKKYATNF